MTVMAYSDYDAQSLLIRLNDGTTGGTEAYNQTVTVGREEKELVVKASISATNLGVTLNNVATANIGNIYVRYVKFEKIFD